ncbi:MAG: ATP-grasp domain-containing protein [Candidatus Sulfotelmatobacter sp.]
MARVLVLDGHSAATLAITRSLGRAKYWVAVGSNRGIDAPAESSRYCRLSTRYPVPYEDASGFVETVLEFARKNEIELIIPATDFTIAPLSKNRHQFQGVSRLALGADATIELAADKFRTISLARELRIPVPETVLVSSLEDLDRAAPNWDFPVVVKDRFSVRWAGNRAVLGSVAYAYSIEDLKKKVGHRLKEAGDVLIQRFVQGAGIGFSCLAAEGKVWLPFSWLRVRETDPRGSGSSAQVSIPLTPEVEEASRALVTQAGLGGICMVEFKQPHDGGPPALMEINARPWGSLPLPIACGINYPLLWVEWLLTGKLPPERIEYKKGILCRRLVNELTHLEHTFHGTPPGWPLPYPGFFETLLKISLPWYPGMCYADFWFRDPSPGLSGLGSWFSGHLRQRFKSKSSA